jgi:hypothetical protein
MADSTGYILRVRSSNKLLPWTFSESPEKLKSIVGPEYAANPAAYEIVKVHKVASGFAKATDAARKARLHRALDAVMDAVGGGDYYVYSNKTSRQATGLPWKTKAEAEKEKKSLTEDNDAPEGAYSVFYHPPKMGR